MRVLALAAVPHPSGNRIDLSWIQPAPSEFPGTRIVRRELSHPLSPTPASPEEGVVIADTSPTSPDLDRIRAHGGGRYTASDTGLRNETVYYYAVFPYAGNPPEYDADIRNRATAMATAPYNMAAHMADLLPALYHRYDAAPLNVAPGQATGKGQLRRFLELPGGELDLLYSFTRAIRDLHDVDRIDSRLLPLLAQWIGWRMDHRLETDVQRAAIRNAPHLYKRIGVIPTLEATVKRLVGWETRTKEFVHNVFRSNQPERLNLWLRERNSAGAWSAPRNPLSLDFAYDGRPAAVRDGDGVLWLFYHALGRGRSDIRYKTFHERSGWTASEPLTNRARIDKYPTAVLHGTALTVFWSTYDESARLWRISLRTRTAGQWSAVAPLGAIAPFADNDVPRRYPWAVIDSARSLWLFWQERVGHQWQLRYNRYDGATWSLSTAATFPPDAGTDPRVESAPFVVFHPADAGQRLWVFWARSETTETPGQPRWRIVYRVKASLNPAAADWSTVRTLPPGPAGSQDREPAILLKPNGDLEVFWSSTRAGTYSIWHATLNRTTHAWGTAERLGQSPYTHCDPLPISSGSAAMLIYRANESVTYTSSVYSATETSDQRFAGSTTVDAGNTAKRALWGTFDDFQAFTAEAAVNGASTDARRYSRETVGLYLKPNTADGAVIQRNQHLLRHALREFLPAPVRALLITEAP